MIERTIYLDNAATTKPDPEVVKEMNNCFAKVYGNPSSPHSEGMRARKKLEKSREIIAEALGAKRTDILFTSGGTESDNLAIKGAALANKDKGNHIITSRIEHKAVLEACRELEKEGFQVTYLDVDEDGMVDPQRVAAAITDETILVSIMLVNNEIGTIQPIREIGKECRKRNVLFHTDAVQGFMKVKFDVEEDYVDMASISAHKIHGPKGVGALYVREGVEIEKLMHGGPHEQDMRAGTPNVPAIAGFAKAVELMGRKDVERMEKVRDYLIGQLTSLPDAKLNGDRQDRVCNNVNICFKGVDAFDLVNHLNHSGVFISTGSACTSQTIEPSYVLTAMGLSEEEASSSVRITPGKDTAVEDAAEAVHRIKSIVTSLRKISKMQLEEKR